MLPQALTFALSARERDVMVLLPHQQLAIRHTRSTLEFLCPKGKTGTGVICVEGRNLGILLREILRGTVTTIGTGPHGPSWARCHVTRIYDRLGWTKAKDKLALNPNPVNPLYLEFETGTTRDLWPRSSLAAFAVPRGPAEKFLFQYPHDHAYVLDAEEGTFSPRLQAFLAAKFTSAMTNRLSVFNHSLYGSRVPPVPRLSFATIQHQQRDLAARGEWNVIMDFREQYVTPRPALQID